MTVSVKERKGGKKKWEPIYQKLRKNRVKHSITYKTPEQNESWKKFMTEFLGAENEAEP